MDGDGAPLSDAPPAAAPPSPLRSDRRSTRRRPLLLLPALAFLLIFFAYPVASIVATGFMDPAQDPLTAAVRVLGAPSFPGIVAFTLVQATLSTVLTLLVGLPGAFLMARFEFPGKRLVRALTLVPFILPTVVVASAFVALLGPRSPLNAAAVSLFGLDGPPLRLDGSLWAIVAAHVFYNHAVVVRIVGGLWSQLDERVEDAARVLGAGRWTTFRTVTLPLLRPAIASASSIVFLFSLTSFGVILLLGDPRTVTLEVEIYRRTAALLDLAGAAVLSTIQIVGVFLLLVVYARYQERVAVEQRPVGRRSPRPPLRGGRRAFLLAELVLLGVLVLLPLAVLVERSLATGDGYGLDWFASLWRPARATPLFVPPGEAIGNSLAFAGVAMLIAVGLGLPAAVAIAARRRWWARGADALLMLPLGTSAVTVGFGFIVALDEPPLDLRATEVLVPLAHALIAVPFVIRAAVPIIRSIDARLREAAAVLGASPARVWREIDLPVIGRAALVGAGFAAAVSLGEFGATVFVARPESPTIPIAVFRLLGQPGAATFGQAMAMSTILMVLTAAAVLLIESVRGSERGPF